VQKHIVFRVGGEGGEGVISCGEMLTLVLARMGNEIYTFRSYPAEIKGGYAMFQVRTSPEVLFSHGSALDILICFNQEAYDRSWKDLRNPNSVVIYDSSSCQPKEGVAAIHYPVPASDLARLEMRNYLTKNVIFLGVLAKLFGVDFTMLQTILKKKFARKGEAILNLNFQALKKGYQYVEQNIKKEDTFQVVEQSRDDNRIVISGNQALAMGAIAAGCRFYAGYPITPATDIMEFLARELPRYKGVVVQAEDEIAALSMVLGAGYTGVKSMTASSGPGISLMAELLGLGGMAEIPAVIVDCQRAGPSTGMPTKTEQSDLNHALYGGHGESPRIVMALSSVEDAFFGIIRAFNYAVRCQTPVIVLSDQYLAQRTATIRKPDLSKVIIEERKKPTAAELEHYKRFRITETGVSPMSVPGEKGGVFTATGIEHGEDCELSYESDNHTRMMDKRFRKLNLVLKGADLYRRYGVQDQEIGIIGWGSSEGVIREAVEKANDKGLKVAAFHPRILYPMLPEIDVFIRSCKQVIVPELNYTGQFAREIRANFGVDVISFTKVAGLPFTPDEIVHKIEEVHGQLESKKSKV